MTTELGSTDPQTDIDRLETHDWIESLRDVLRRSGPGRASELLRSLQIEAQRFGAGLPVTSTTPHVNTIPVEKQPPYPGNREIELRIKNVIRWNAMAMVVAANQREHGIGGHISTYASAATLYEVAFNHFFRGLDHPTGGDLIFFQGHGSPGIYGRAYLERRLDAQQLHNFRREFAETGGLSSYPHPWLMPDFWQFPSVSMGLGPLMAIYQARFMRYLEDRGILEPSDRKVWAFLGDGETDEPEALGAISLAERERLDNLIFVVNCNLQRLDGPVRGNGQIIQELEAVFRGVGWNVVKVLWGGEWDGYAHAALERFVNTSGECSRLLLGPWGHAGVLTHRAFEEAVPSSYDHDSELLSFFDAHLWPDRAPNDTARARYYVFGREAWAEASSWPPPGNVDATLFLGDGRSLGDRPGSGADAVAVDRTVGTGERSRWRGLLAGFVAADYLGLGARLRGAVAFDSAPLDRALEIAGHPEAHLWIRTDAADGTFFVYLLDVAPDGSVAYVTEGQLRAIHRAVAAPPPGFVALRPYRTYARGDARPLDSGAPTPHVIGLLPAAHAFARGHRVRLVVTATDRDHFAAPPDDFRAFEVLRGESTPSRLVLPSRPA